MLSASSLVLTELRGFGQQGTEEEHKLHLHVAKTGWVQMRIWDRLT